MTEINPQPMPEAERSVESAESPNRPVEEQIEEKDSNEKQAVKIGNLNRSIPRRETQPVLNIKESRTSLPDCGLNASNLRETCDIKNPNRTGGIKLRKVGSVCLFQLFSKSPFSGSSSCAFWTQGKISSYP